MAIEVLEYDFGQHMLIVDLWLQPFGWYFQIKEKGSRMSAYWPDVGEIALAPMQDADWQNLAGWLDANGIGYENAWPTLGELYQKYIEMDEALLNDGQLPLQMPDEIQGTYRGWYEEVAGLDYATSGVLGKISPQKLITMDRDSLMNVRNMGKTRVKAVLDLILRLKLGQQN